MRLSIDEAAIALGLSVSSVRRRVKAGSLQVERETTPAGFRYVVVLPDEPPSQPPSQAPSTDDAPRSQTPSQEPSTLSQSDQVAALTAERDWLRQRVEELTTLLNREQEAVLRLTTQAPSQRLLNQVVTPTQAPSQPPSQTPTRRSWWRRLLRVYGVD